MFLSLFFIVLGCFSRATMRAGDISPAGSRVAHDGPPFWVCVGEPSGLSLLNLRRLARTIRLSGPLQPERFEALDPKVPAMLGGEEDHA